MSKLNFKHKEQNDNSLIDLYLNNENKDNLFYPSIPATLFSHNSDLNPENEDDYTTNSDTRNIPVTPLRCAWEVGSSWQKYLYGESFTYGGSGCWVEKNRNQYRQQVVGVDGQNYSEPCSSWISGFDYYMRVGGYMPQEPTSEKNVNYLPPGFVTFRGWAGCTGWEGWRQDQFEYLNDNVSMGSFTESYGNYHMHHGNLFWGLSQVCDTGDILAFSESGGATSSCQAHCENMSSFMFSSNLCGNAYGGRHESAVAWIAPSDLDTDTRFNNAIQALFVNAVTIDGVRELGEIANIGKTGIYWCMGDMGIYCESGPDCDSDTLADFFYDMVYIVLGDPSLPIWTGKPRKIRVSMDDSIQPSLWGRWKMRPRHWYDEATDTGQNHMSDEIPLSISLGENRDVFLDPVCETSGEPLVGANVTLVYEAPLPEPFDQVYSWKTTEDQGSVPAYDYGPVGRKHYHPYLLRYTTVDESGLATFVNWADRETWIEGVGEVQLQVGDYIKAYINTETRRHGLPYEQKVITFRLTE